MTETELHDWIDACRKMELHVNPAKARRSWKSGALDAEEELQKRAGRSQE